jgi:predicted ATPase
MMSGALQQHIGESGWANSILHYGSKRTPQITNTLHFQTVAGKNTYHMRLVYAAQDTLLFADESICYAKQGRLSFPPVSLGAGHKESMLVDNSINSKGSAKTANVIKNIMSRWRVYQFHDTSPLSRIRQHGNIHDNRYLRDDAGNLAAYLYMLQQTQERYYKRIVATIQQIAPFFRDFALVPSRLNQKQIALEWKERSSDMIFGAHQLSDGTLRMMALVTLLLQPEIPELIIIDEPELGLHPYAISVLASLLRSISSQRQIIISTQSVTLIDHFDIDNLIVADRKDDQSVFRRLKEEEFKTWLDDYYTLGQLWEKNVLGGRPSR